MPSFTGDICSEHVHVCSPHPPKLLFVYLIDCSQRAVVYVSDGPPGRSRGGCMRCQQSRSLQLAVKVLYGFVAFLVVTVVVLASLGEPSVA